MSLQYIIDAYNLVNHPLFNTARPAANIQLSLIEFLKVKKLTGSNNKAILVFDGYPPDSRVPEEEDFTCIFSRKIEADELIKRIIEGSVNPKNIVVISDDKQVQLASRLLRARVLAIEDFVCGKNKRKCRSLPEPETKLNYTQMQKINEEFKKLWLK